MLITTCLLTLAQGAWAQEPVSYVNRTWNGSKVVETPSTCTTYTEISGNNPSEEQALNGEWYVVKENASRKRIIIKAHHEVNIILCDGATLNSIVTFEHSGIPATILHVYGQEGGTGKLVADARNDEKNAGIGANTASDGYKRLGELYVHGGKIEARGGKYAAGIGGAWYLGHNYNGEVYVYGGEVYAYGGAYGAGIGGGQNDDGADVTVYGGTVWASGGTDSAGIGSGEQTSGDRKGGTLTVWGGTVYGSGEGWGAGIGGGEDSDGAEVSINGGKVIAWAGKDAGNKNGSAIGSEDGDNHRGTLRIHDCMMVNAGQTPNGTSLFPKETRVPACFFRPYAIVEVCDHPSGITYTINSDDGTHTSHCKHCAVSETAEHFNSDGNGTCVCGYKASEGVWTITLAKPGVDANGDFDGSYSGPGYGVAKGQAFILPECDVIVNGYTFKGWVVGSTSTGLEASDGATFLSPGEEYTPTSNPNNIKAHYEPLNISLADNANNEETLYMYAGKKAHSVTLADRTLFKDGKWNTLCLPFSLSAEQIAANGYFAGATLKTLDADAKNGFDTTDGTLYLSFKDATEIEAGVPYLVKWTSGEPITDPVFEGVTVSSTAAQAVESTTAGLESIQMVGCYSPVSVTADDKSILFLGDANTLYYSTIDRQIRSCRAYFSVPYIKNNAGAKARAFALSFDGEDVTGILGVSADSTDVKDGVWYSLDGVRLSGKPTQRGIYLNNGKKIIIK